MTQTVEFMFASVAYRVTVYKGRGANNPHQIGLTPPNLMTFRLPWHALTLHPQAFIPASWPLLLLAFANA